MQALAVSRHVQHKTLVCQRRGLLLLTGAASVFFLGGARTLPAAARPAAFELLQRQQRAMASGGARAAAMPHAEGSLVVDGQAVPWRVELPSGPAPPSGFPLAVIVTHGSTGDLTRGELPLFAASAAAVGVPCLRFTCTSQDIPVRARAMQELMLRAPDVHPALASVARWVVGGRSLGARTAALVAYTRGLTPDELNNGVDPELDEGERAMARRMAEAGVEVAGAVLSAFPVHMPDTPDDIRYYPISDLKLPLLILRGTNDPYSNPGPWLKLKESLTTTSLEVVEIPKGDHWLRVSKSEAEQAPFDDRIRQALQAFLSKINLQQQSAPAAGGSKALGRKAGPASAVTAGVGRPAVAADSSETGEKGASKQNAARQPPPDMPTAA